MKKITNKIKLSGLFAAVFVGTLTFASCSSEKKTEESETSPPLDSTEQMMAPDTLTPPDSLPTLDSNASTRPEPRKT